MDVRYCTLPYLVLDGDYGLPSGIIGAPFRSGIGSTEMVDMEHMFQRVTFSNVRSL